MNSSAYRQKAGRRPAKRSGTWTALLILTTSLIAMSSMTGCTGRSGGVVIDPRLTAPCEIPQLQGETNRDVWVLAVEQKAELEAVCRRMDVIRGLTR